MLAKKYVKQDIDVKQLLLIFFILYKANAKDK